MSIFSPYSRSNSTQQQEPTSDFLTDLQAEDSSLSRSGMHYGSEASTSTSPGAGLEPMAQVKEGVSDFLGSLDLSEISGKLSTVSSGIEYLNLEENIHANHGALPSRGWSDDLCYGAGTAYLGGLATGGLWGFIEGSRTPAPNFKIRINSLLNSMTRRGPFVGNSGGVLALYYNSLYSMIAASRDGKRDNYTSISAAAITGALFKSPKGLASSAKSALICSAFMSLYQIATNYESFAADFNFNKMAQNA